MIRYRHHFIFARMTSRHMSFRGTPRERQSALYDETRRPFDDGLLS